MKSKNEITFSDLVDLEPRLEMLLKNVIHHNIRKPGERYCPITAFYQYYHPKIFTLVGPWAKTENPILKMSAVYFLVHEKCWHALPACLKLCTRCDL